MAGRAAPTPNRRRTATWRPPARATTVAIGAALVLLCAGLDRVTMSGDGMAAYVTTESLLLDGDFDLTNQYARYGDNPISAYAFTYVPATRTYTSAWPFGVALFWGPFLYPFYLLDRLGAFPPYYTMYNLVLPGSFRAIGMAIALAANVCTIGAWLLAGRLAARACARPAADLIAAALVLGTPLLFYAAIEPSYSHAPEAFAVAWLLHASFTNPADTVRRGVYLGVVAGLAILLRWQLATYLLVFGGAALLDRQWARLAGMVAGAAAIVWTIPYAWYVATGSPLQPPILSMNPEYFGGPKLVEMLFSDLRGLLPWSPVTGVGLLGLAVGVRRHRHEAIVLLLCVAAQLVFNSLISDWWAGESFGNRRLTSLYAIWVIGAAWLVEAAGAWAARRSRPGPTAARAAVVAVTWLLAWPSFVLALDYYPSRLPPGPMTHSALQSHWRERGSWNELVHFHHGGLLWLGWLSPWYEPTLRQPPGTIELARAWSEPPVLHAIEAADGRVRLRGERFTRQLVVNLFQRRPDGSVPNLGGLDAAGSPRIPITVRSPEQLEFDAPVALQPGRFHLQLIVPLRPDGTPARQVGGDGVYTASGTQPGVVTEPPG